MPKYKRKYCSDMPEKIKEYLDQIWPGTMLCDCRYKHLAAKEVIEEYTPPTWLAQLYGRVPDWLYSWLWRAFCHKVCDLDIMMEDGSYCSAINCCHLAPHEWKHPKFEGEIHE